MERKTVTAVSSPYATGGGGVCLEHEYSGFALACLLLGQPVDGLGDEFIPTLVAMQQEAHSPVDDVVIHGISPAGERTLRVACRHRPVLGRSNGSTVKLFADFVGALIDDKAGTDSGHLRLGLAVAGPYGPAEQLATLTEVARRQPSRASFQAAVVTPGAYSKAVRDRLANVDEIIDAVLIQLGREVEIGRDAKEISWQLLRALFVIQLQMEGDAAHGRTDLVARLQAVTGDASRANDLRLRLVEIASKSAIRAGGFTLGMLRRELRGFGPLGASGHFVHAHSQLALLESELRRRTQRSLPRPGNQGSFILDRSKRQNELVEVISAAPPGSVVLARGEPDVGKSALALAAIDSVRSTSGAALAMSLRDLPDTAVQLRVALGLGPDDLLAAAPSAPVSVLLLDGAEVVQEGNAGVLGALLSAAIVVGMTTVLVARDDAAGAVLELLRARGIDKPVEFGILPLSNDEISVVVNAISELAKLTSDPRASWLLRRLGLVELLLRAAWKSSGLPETLSSEAEIFATVWSSLVRCDEITVGGVSPDDRETAIIEVARQLLTGTARGTTLGTALSSLRSDGILITRGRSAAWGSTDRFESDLLRDFATARLLLRDGLEVLRSSSAPRWAVRAARLFAQARMAQVAPAGGRKLAECWMELRRQFSNLSIEHGLRWAELPWEALLTAGWAEETLKHFTLELVCDTDIKSEAVQCVKRRFSEAGACNPMVGAPVIAWLLETAEIVKRERAYGENPIEELLASWLRGVARLEVAGQNIQPYRALRSRIRDLFLRDALERGEEERLESLGLLGSESSDATVAALRTFAQEAPAFLAPIVESLDSTMSLASQNPALLADLAEAYYVEEPNAWSDSLLSEGIRNHHGGGWDAPSAAWYRGPFLPLLRRDLSRGLNLIDHMLETGARRRIEVVKDLGISGGVTALEEQDAGVLLDLFGSGRRLFVGDAHVWSWYRGSSVGPYPCMSALLSLEMVMDEVVAFGISPRNIAMRVLRAAKTLATAGLVYGFLVRHIDRVTTELDEFLATPCVWDLEFGRCVSEGMLHVQGPDPEDRVGRERRGWTPREVAMHLVVRTSQHGDTEGLERLRGVGRRLVEAAGGENAPPEVRQWAAHLDWDSYTLHKEEGRYVLELSVPQDVAQALAPAQAHSAATAEMYRLLNRYRVRRVTPYRCALPALAEGVELIADLQLAQRVETELDDASRGMLHEALAGIAAAVLQSSASGISVADESLGWAYSQVLSAAMNTRTGPSVTERAMNPDGADRKAALAIPYALVPTHLESSVQTPSPDATAVLGTLEQMLEAALTAGTTSHFIEVRGNAAEGLRVLLGHPCEKLSDGRCWHEQVWQAIDAGARSVVLGPWTHQGRRYPDVITGDLVVGLSNRLDRDLMLTHVTPAAICALDAARDKTCISSRAGLLRDALLDAYARAACHWATEHYDWRDEQHAAFASAVMRWAADTDRPVILEVAETLRASPDALADFLHALTIVATHEADLVSTLVTIWPNLMHLGLAVLRAGPPSHGWRDVEKLVKNLVPDPSPSGYTPDAEAIVSRAQGNWLPIAAVTAHIDEWLQQAQDQRWCIDALVAFLQAQPLRQQADVGLRWVRQLVVDEDGNARTSGFLLVDWLEHLRDSNILSESSWPHYRAVLDALVLGNYSGARALQQRDE